jgi:hypothetical protein
MIVKPSISFLTNDNDALLITDTASIITAMTGNPNYPAPTPDLVAVTAAQTEFSAAVADAAGGGVALTSAKNDKRAALVVLLRELASYVQVACKGDLTVLLSSGFPIQKPQRQPLGVLPAPANLTVTLGARTGELNAGVAPVAGAAIYNWRVTTASAPTVEVQSAQTTAASNTFGNLTPGVVYNIQANVVGSAGPSNWSDPIAQMVV